LECVHIEGCGGGGGRLGGGGGRAREVGAAAGGGRRRERAEPERHPGGAGVDHRDPIRVHLIGGEHRRFVRAGLLRREVYGDHAVRAGGEQLAVGLGEPGRGGWGGGPRHPPLGQRRGDLGRSDLFTFLPFHPTDHHRQRHDRDPGGEFRRQIRGR